MGDNDQTLGDKVYTQEEFETKFNDAMKKKWKEKKIENSKSEKVEDSKSEKDLEERAYEAGLDPEVYKELEDLKKFKSEMVAERKAKKDKEGQKDKVEEEFRKQRTDFAEKYPDIDLTKLENDKDFVDFVETANDKLSLTEIFDKYNGFTGKIQKEAVEKIQSKFKRTTSSGKEGAGGSYNLTANQLSVAKGAGMTPKEYAELLKDVN